MWLCSKCQAPNPDVNTDCSKCKSPRQNFPKNPASPQRASVPSKPLEKTDLPSSVMASRYKGLASFLFVLAFILGAILVIGGAALGMEGVSVLVSAAGTCLVVFLLSAAFDAAAEKIQLLSNIETLLIKQLETKE